MGLFHHHHHPGAGHGRGHSHGHDHEHEHAPEAPRAIVRAMVMTIIFMVVELIGGWWANSLALIGDAAHMLTDVGALLLSLFVIWVARRPSTPSMSFGYHRAEILGALASGLAIWGISGVLVYESILRLREPPEVQGPIVLAVAAIGLAANLASMWMLHSAREENINVRAAYLHLLTDSMGSIGAVIAGAVLWRTEWRPIDPIVTILFAALMLISSWELVREAVGVLMESAPSHLDPKDVSKTLQGIAGVSEVHDLHIWSVSSGRLALSVHLIGSSGESQILASANQLLKEKYGIAHTTIQVEHPDRFDSDHCYDCTP